MASLRRLPSPFRRAVRRQEQRRPADRDLARRPVPSIGALPAGADPGDPTGGGVPRAATEGADPAPGAAQPPGGAISLTCVAMMYQRPLRRTQLWLNRSWLWPPS